MLPQGERTVVTNVAALLATVTESCNRHVGIGVKQVLGVSRGAILCTGQLEQDVCEQQPEYPAHDTQENPYHVRLRHHRCTTPRIMAHTGLILIAGAVGSDESSVFATWHRTADTIRG